MPSLCQKKHIGRQLKKPELPIKLKKTANQIALLNLNNMPDLGLSNI